MPRNPALSEAINLVNAKIAECNTILRDATYALDNAESALSALGTAALIVDIRAQRDRWDAIAGELRRLVGDDAPTYGAVAGAYVGAAISTSTLPAGEQGKVCPTCGGRGNYIVLNSLKVCRSCGGSGYVEIR